MLNNITNFFNLIKTGKVKTQLDSTDLLPIGTRDTRYSGQYQPTMIKYSDLVAGLVGGSNGQVLFNDNDTIAGASGLYWDKINQRVGIGTSTPAYKLDVSGNGLIANILLSDNSSDQRITASAPYLFLIGGGAILQMNSGGFTTGQYNSTAKFDIKGKGSTSATTSLLIQNSASTELFRIRDNGAVLINTSSDEGYKLDVNGNGRFKGGLVSAKAGYVGFINDGLYSSMGYNTLPEDVSTVLKIGFGAGTSVTTLLKLDNTTNNSAAGPTTVLLDILANPSQTAPLLQWRNSAGAVLGVINSAGNVGIGTSSPSDTLYVNGTAKFTLAGNSAFGATLVTDASGNTSFSKIGGATLFINSAGNMVISPTSRLGIGGFGTNAPRTQVSILGADDSNPALGVANGKFSILNGGGNGSYGLVFGVSGSGISHIQSQRVDGTATAYALTLQSAGGGVLIGTTTDAGYKLDVNGTARIGNADGIKFTPGNNSSITFMQGGDRISLTRLNSDKLQISAAGTNTVIGNGISTDGSAHTWLLEGEITAASTLDTTKHVKVFINGVAYKLAVCV